MKVLVVHNFYASAAPSGENVAVLRDCDLLRSAGVEVELFQRSNDALVGSRAAAGAAVSAVWNSAAASDLKARIAAFGPDVVHIHNVFPLMSTSVFRIPHGVGVPVVATLHNYRFFCARGVPLRNGVECFDCRGNSARAVLHGCYRGSRAASIPAALFVQINRTFGVMSSSVDRVIALTNFQSRIAVSCGVPEERVRVRANPIGIYASKVRFEQRFGGAVFVGRLSEEKGLLDLLRAYQESPNTFPVLDIVGDGPLRQTCEKWTADNGLSARVRFHGALPIEQAQRIISQSKLLIAPFKSWEGLPTVLLEAAALGVPAVCPNFGSMQDVVIDGRSGYLYSPDNPANLVRAIAYAVADERRLAAVADTAGDHFRLNYGDDSALRALLEIYSEATSAWGCGKA